MNSYHKLEVLTFTNEQQMFEELESLLESKEEMEELFGNIEFLHKEEEIDCYSEPLVSKQDCKRDYKYRTIQPYYNNGIGFPKSFPAKLYITVLSISPGNKNFYCRWGK